MNSNRMRLAVIGINAAIVFSTGNVKANFISCNRPGGYCNFDLMDNGADHVYNEISTVCERIERC